MCQIIYNNIFNAQRYWNAWGAWFLKKLGVINRIWKFTINNILIQPLY